MNNLSELHNVTLGIHHSHSPHFSVVSPLLSTCLLFSLSAYNSIHQPSVHALVSTLCFGATADCSGGLQYTQGVFGGVKMCVCPHTHTHTFSDGGLSSYFSVFDLTCLGGGSIHCAKPCGLPQKKQNILCVCMSVLLCELQTDTYI